MAKKPAPADDDGLLDGAPAPAAKKTPAAKKAATPAAPAKKAAAPAAKKAAAPAAKKAAAAASGAKGVRGEGKFYMSPDDKDALAKKIGTVKKAATTKELAEKFNEPTWKVRRAINEVLVPAGKGSVEKAGTVLTYTPA